MKDYGPRPTIEDHYHIQELIDGQERRAADRTYHKDRVKALEEREQEIRVADGKRLMPFWCATCAVDFAGEAIKQVEVDWANPSQQIAFYKTKCFKGHWCVRLITDKVKDAYFYKSKMVARDRQLHHNDLKQSFETGYNIIYGNQRN